MSESWSVDEQREICERIGYNVDDWNHKNPEQQKKLATAALRAIVGMVDKDGKPISFDDYRFLSTITG